MATSPAPPVTRPAPSVGSPPPANVRTLVDDFLDEQRRLSAVERFSQAHEATATHEVAGIGGGLTPASPVPLRRYRDLVPATPPGPGQQYAFEVDLDACSGCKACVAACRSLNGLDQGEAWRDVGLLVGTGDVGLQQPVTTGCHHCAEPGCLDGCPVNAYEKGPDGIVTHLDDQCIGCNYCTLTCPYEVPQYDAARGIVRKCDLCQDRLGAGEAPACVQACPTEAITISIVDVATAGTQQWGFAAPDPATTRPTTVFRSSRDLATDVAPADRHAVRPRPAHLPLVVMLVLTQFAVGAFVVLELLRSSVGLSPGSAAAGAGTCLALTGLALGASLAHLGRPQYAWRALLGLGHSWLSREIVAFGLFAVSGILHALALGGWLPAPLAMLPPDLGGSAAMLVGVTAVGTSVMVYVATGRAGWRPAPVTVRFALTTVVLGTAGALLLVTPGHWVDTGVAATMAGIVLAGSVAALAVDLVPLRQRHGDPSAAATRTARILAGPLAGQVRLRVGLGLLAAISATGAVLAFARPQAHEVGVVGVALALGATLAGELLARTWFFAAEGSERMPGGMP